MRSKIIQYQQMEGFIKLHRSLLQSFCFSHPITLKIFIWLLCRARFVAGYVNIKIGKGYTDVYLERGQMLFGRFKAEEELSVDGSTIYKHLKKLEENETIIIQSNNQYSIITICNYGAYQCYDNDIVTTKEQPKNKDVATKAQQSNSRVTQKKKDKNVNKENNDTGTYTEEEIKAFEAFNNWITEHSPKIHCMQKPFVIKDFLKIKKDFDSAIVKEVLSAMQNHKDLLKKYESANLTLRNWIKRRIDNSNSNPHAEKTTEQKVNEFELNVERQRMKLEWDEMSDTDKQAYQNDVTFFLQQRQKKFII